MLVAVFTGTIIDDLGMRIETAWLDSKRERRTAGGHSQEWWAYLRKPYTVEQSGRRHLRRLVAMLKFELGVPVGYAMMIPAVWLNSAVNPWLALVITAFGLGVSFYLLFEAAATHEVLGKLRHELLKDDVTRHAVISRKTMQSA